MYHRSRRLRSNELIITPCSDEIGEMSFGRSKVSFVLQEMPTFDYKAIAMGETCLNPSIVDILKRYFEFFIKTTRLSHLILLPYGDQAFKIDFYVFRKCEEIAEHTLNAINQKVACDKCQSYRWQINETLCTGHVRYSELATKININ